MSKSQIPASLPRSQTVIGAFVQEQAVKFWKKPILRQDWNEEQDAEKIEWKELFFDLILVAFILNLGHALFEEFSGYHIGLSYFYFYTFWYGWNNLHAYFTRFVGTDDIYGNVVLYLYYCGLIGMAATVDFEFHKKLGFSIGNASAHFCLTLLLLQVAIEIPRARAYSVVCSIMLLLTFVFFLIAGLVENEYVTLTLWIIGGSFDFLASFLPYALNNRFKSALPLNVAHTAERNGCMIMLVLGESVLSLLSTITISNSDQAIVLFAGFLLVFSLKNLYFSSQPHEIEAHALRYGRMSGRVYATMHPVLGFALFCVGISIKFFHEHAHEHEILHEDEMWFFSSSLGISLVVLNIIRLAHPFPKRRLRIWVFRIFVILLIFISPFYYSEHFRGPLVVIVFAIFCVILSVVDTMSTEVVKKHHPKKHHKTNHHKDEEITSPASLYSIHDETRGELQLQVQTSGKINSNTTDNEAIPSDSVSPSPEPTTAPPSVGSSQSTDPTVVQVKQSEAYQTLNEETDEF